MLKRLMSALFLCLSVLACRESHVEEVKNFRIFVETDTPALKYSVAILVRDYNSRLGYEALTLVDKKEDSTSLIHFREGLVNDGRKLGLGQWTTLQKQSVQGTFNQNQTTTIQYGMDIVFDQENFLKKSAYVQDPQSDAYQHLFHLFCHEVGHGMQMDHSTDEDSVMYPSIAESGSRPVNYAEYFQNVRQFMADPIAATAQHRHIDEEETRVDELAY